MYGLDLMTFVKSLREDTSDNNNGSKDSSSFSIEGIINYLNANNAGGDGGKLKIHEKESIKVVINAKKH